MCILHNRHDQTLRSKVTKKTLIFWKMVFTIVFHRLQSMGKVNVPKFFNFLKLWKTVPYYVDDFVSFDLCQGIRFWRRYLSCTLKVQARKFIPVWTGYHFDHGELFESLRNPTQLSVSFHGARIWGKYQEVGTSAGYAV